MAFRWMYDASTPPENPPHWYAAAVYIGGDTPNVWTLEEMKAQPVECLLPIWTASDRANTAEAAGSDAWGIINKLAALGVTEPVTVALDIETVVYSTYLLAMNDFLAPHLLMDYGSLSTIIKNPKTSGGRWAADWTDNIDTDDLIGTDDINTVQIANSAMTGHPWDWSIIDSAVKLWRRPS